MPVVPPVLGRPSGAAAEPARLRDRGSGRDAAYRGESGTSQFWELRAVSVAGVRHRLTGRAGEDAYCWAVAGDELVVAVADGVGSSPGAASAASAAVDAACQFGPGTALDHRFAGANSAAGAGPGATTLVVAVLASDGTVVVGRIGDSTALTVSGAGSAELFAAGSGEVGSATAALPCGGHEMEFYLEVASATVTRGSCLVLATDGVADPWRDGPTTVAPSLASVLTHLPSALELLVWADFARQGCHDDRTLLAVWRRG